MKYTLIVTHGRTGSTLLQGILNAIDGWHIKGENFNFAFGLYESYLSLKDTCDMKDTSMFDVSSTTHPWYGAADYNLNEYRQQISDLIKSTLLLGEISKSINVCGFKEVHYFDLFKKDPSGESLSGYLDFLLEILNPCKIVILQRELKNVIKSAWWAKEDPEKILELLTDFNDFLFSYSQKNKDITFLIDYENITLKNPQLYDLFEFLGDYPAEDDLNNVLMTKHSYNLRSFIPYSVPAVTSQNHHESLMKADQLYSNQKFLDASNAYKDFISQYKQGSVKKLPLYASIRAEEQAYVVRSSQDHYIAYFPIPSCASASVSKMLYHIINNKPYEGEGLFLDNIHDYFDGDSSELSLEEYNNFFKVIVIRDPIERFISGYNNRILGCGDLDEVLKSMYIWDNPNINDFAMNIEDHILRSIKVESYFQPMYLRIGQSLDLFDKVIPFEEINSLTNILNQKTEQNLVLPQAKKYLVPKALIDLSEEALEKLLNFYGKDYELLSDYYSLEKVKESYKGKPTRMGNLSMSFSFSSNDV